MTAYIVLLASTSSKAVVQGCPVEKEVLTISQNLQENICAGVFPR